MRPAGLALFEQRDRRKPGLYSFEQRREIKLAPRFARQLRASPKAWAFLRPRPRGINELRRSE